MRNEVVVQFAQRIEDIMGGRTKSTSARKALTKSQRNRISDSKTKYSGTEAVTESYVEIVNGIKVIRTKTRYRKRRKRKD